MTRTINHQESHGTPYIPRRKPLAATIGVFGVGHHTYWPQFDGLLDEMKRKLAVFMNKVRAQGDQVIDFGIVDDARSAYALRSQLKAASLDLIFCDMLTYATSATFGVIVRDLDVPIVLVALQPMKALDYSRASTFLQLSNDDFCAVPEFTGVALRMGKRPPPVILGTSRMIPKPTPRLRIGAASRVFCTTSSGRVSATSGTCSKTCWICRPTQRRLRRPSDAILSRPSPTTSCGSSAW